MDLRRSPRLRFSRSSLRSTTIHRIIVRMPRKIQLCYPLWRRERMPRCRISWLRPLRLMQRLRQRLRHCEPTARPKWRCWRGSSSASASSRGSKPTAWTSARSSTRCQHLPSIRRSTPHADGTAPLIDGITAAGSGLQEAPPESKVLPHAVVDPRAATGLLGGTSCWLPPALRPRLPRALGPDSEELQTARRAVAEAHAEVRPSSSAVPDTTNSSRHSASRCASCSTWHGFVFQL